jgi:hypothetical protein
MIRPISFVTGLAFLLAFVLTSYFFRRYPVGKAALFGIFMGMLFLPEQVNFKLPLLPEFNKYRVENFALLFCVLSRPQLPKVERWWYLVVAASFIGSYFTFRTNTETITSGIVTMQGLNFKDGMYLALSDLTYGLLAAYIGMRCFHAERDVMYWVRCTAGVGLIYAALILFEVRMSPQLHTWIYGHPAFDDFGQSMRWGGYRPVVFMTHGLATSLFELAPLMMAAVLTRFNMRIWKLSGRQAMWLLFVTVLLCKSTGTWIYLAFAMPMARYASAKAMHRLAVIFAVIICLYPWMRATKVFPVEWLLDVAASISVERMESLKFRFDNEDVLLAHSMKKMWFGWSTSYGRNMLFDEYGKLATTTDGGWLIALGNGGLVGLTTYLSVPVISILLTAKRSKRIRDPKLKIMVATLNLYLSIMWVDILPNGTFTLLPFFLGGALCSITRTLGSRSPERAGASERPRVQKAGSSLRPLAPAPGVAVGRPIPSSPS